MQALNDRPRKVLIVEDNEISRQLLLSYIKRLGFDVSCAANGAQAVELIRTNEQFDLILMDIQMPVMDGLEAATAILSLECTTPMVAVTPNLSYSDRQSYIKHGFSACLDKKFSITQLYECVNAFIPINNPDAFDYAQAAQERLKLYNSFVLTNEDAIERLKARLSNGEVKAAHRIAHNLKGLAGPLHRQGLLFAATEVEKALSRNSSSELEPESITKLESEFNITLKHIKKELAKEQARFRPPNHDDSVRPLLAELFMLLQSRNAAAMNYTDRLSCIPNTEDLINHILDFDFDLALDQLKKLEQSLEP